MIYMFKIKSSAFAVFEKYFLDISHETAWENPLKFFRRKKIFIEPQTSWKQTKVTKE